MKTHDPWFCERNCNFYLKRGRVTKPDETTFPLGKKSRNSENKWRRVSRHRNFRWSSITTGSLFRGPSSPPDPSLSTKNQVIKVKPSIRNLRIFLKEPIKTRHPNLYLRPPRRKEKVSFPLPRQIPLLKRFLQEN